MLKQNGTILAQYPFRLRGGGTAAGSRAVWGRTERINQHVTDAINNTRAAVPNGHLAPSAWILPQVSGGLSSYGETDGQGSLSASILAVKLAEAGLTGSGDMTAVGSLIIQLLANLSGSGQVSAADLKAFLQMAASLTGSGNVTPAALTALGALVAALLGDGTAATSILTGRGALAADIVVTGTGLTTSNVGQAVWSAIAAANNTAGSMGEKLNDAGSAANPWTEVIESGFTAAEVLRILMAVAAGDATGMDGSAVFKSIDGTKDRVTATISGDDRTVTDRDAS